MAVIAVIIALEGVVLPTVLAPPPAAVVQAVPIVIVPMVVTVPTTGIITVQEPLALIPPLLVVLV